MKEIISKITIIFKSHPFTATVFLLLIFFIIGVMVGVNFVSTTAPIERGADKNELRDSGNYTFINPLLECGSSKINSFMYDGLENKVQDAIAVMEEESKIKSMAVYFRDLNNGPWYGYNERENFAPASMLKVPVMIAYYKKAETTLNFLEQKVVFGSSGANVSSAQNIKPKEVLNVGNEYTIGELIEHMIKYSDNSAADYLLRNIDKNYLNEVYVDLGVRVPNADNPGDFMSVKEYAAFYRVLYNASYLSKEMSEKALELLSNSQFFDGLAAGVPPNIFVAHKFGERVNASAVELHDCGIIYYPDSPYLLCIMAKGSDFEDLKKSIAAISKLVYDEVKDEN